MIQYIEKYKVVLAKIILIAGYGISIPGLWLMRSRPDAYELSWIFTILSLSLLLFFHKPFSFKFLLAIFSVGILGWTFEAIGTNTGWVFGHYTYGNSLGPKIVGTPVSMIVNWMLSIYLVALALKSKIQSKWKLAFAGASLMVLYDILLEPVAIRLGMWSWMGGNPPAQNYIAWFLLSFPLVMLIQHFVKRSENPLAIFLLVCQIVFFAALNLMIAFAGF